MRVPVVISSRSIGTSTTATQLSGDRSGNATDFIVPTWCRAIPRVRGSTSITVPTAGQSVEASLRITSTDLNVGNYEVWLEPLASVLGATGMSFNGNGQNAAEYPWNMGATRRLQGGEHFQFFGQAQVANTSAARAAAVVWADSDGPDASIGGQWYSIATSIFNNSSNPVSTGTSAAVVTGTSFTISGQGSVTIRALYGLIAPGTIVASDSTVGWFTLTAPEIAVPLQWNVEPVNGFLGATGQVQSLISQMEGIAVAAVTPTTITNTLTLDVAPANAGKFAVAAMYQ